MPNPITRNLQWRAHMKDGSTIDQVDPATAPVDRSTHAIDSGQLVSFGLVDPATGVEVANFPHPEGESLVYRTRIKHRGPDDRCVAHLIGYHRPGDPSEQRFHFVIEQGPRERGRIHFDQRMEVGHPWHYPVQYHDGCPHNTCACQKAKAPAPLGGSAMRTQTCGGCIFYQPVDATPPAGQCRRFPPGVGVVALPQQSIAGVQLQPVIIPAWPQIAADGWCGEHKETP